MITGIINYLILLVISVFGLLFYHNYVMMLLVAVILCLPVIFAFCTKDISKKLHVSIETKQQNVARNHDIELNISIDNRSFFSSDNIELRLKIFNTYYGNEEMISLTVPATARETRNVNWKFSSKYCGRIVISIESVKVNDIMHIFNRICPNTSDTEIIVMPEQIKIDNKLQLISEGDGKEEQVQYRKGNDVSEISEIREYTEGDKMQMIHWKASAKQGKIMVKEYSMPFTNEFIIVPEMYYDGVNPSKLDHVIDVLYSYALEFLRDGRQFYIGWINAATGEIFSTKIDSEIDVNTTIKQLFYSELEKQPKQTEEYFDGYGRFEGKTVVYVGEAVVKCLS